MKRPEWNLGSTIVVLMLAFAIPAWPAPFTVVDDSPAPASMTSEEQQDIIARLKYQVVARYLQDLLKNRFSQYEAAITPELVDKHIRFYHVGKAPGNRIQIEGEYDAEGLKGWVKIADSKSKEGQTLKPVLIVESKLGGATVSAGETGGASKENPLVQSILQMTNGSLQKFGIVAFLPRGSFSSGDRPRNESEIRSLGSQGSFSGANAAIWVQLTPCRDCGGVRADLSLLNFSQGRSSLNLTSEVAADPASFNQPERAKSALAQLFKDFQTQVERVISKDIFFSNIYNLVIEGIPVGTDMKVYRVGKLVEGTLNKTDFVGQALMKMAEPSRVYLEVLSKMRPNEVLQGIDEARFPGFRLKGVRVDSQTLVVRYLK